MTTTYRTAGAWGAGSGADLTPAQVDTNFYDKETRLNALEALSIAVGIDHITVSGDQMTVVMTDASTQGPFTLPTAEWNPQGTWQPASLYNALDVVDYGGSAYLVLVNHTSDTTFDPDAVIGTQQLYKLIFSFAPITGFERTGTTFTPALADANTYNRMTNAAGCAISIDPAVLFADWTELTFRDESTDTGANCTFSIATPGIINDVAGYLNGTAGKGATVTLKKVGATDAWDIMGLLMPA